MIRIFGTKKNWTAIEDMLFVPDKEQLEELIRQYQTNVFHLPDGRNVTGKELEALKLGASRDFLKNACAGISLWAKNNLS